MFVQLIKLVPLFRLYASLRRFTSLLQGTATPRAKNGASAIGKMLSGYPSLFLNPGAAVSPDNSSGIKRTTVLFTAKSNWRSFSKKEEFHLINWG